MLDRIAGLPEELGLEFGDGARFGTMKQRLKEALHLAVEDRYSVGPLLLPVADEETDVERLG